MTDLIVAGIGAIVLGAGSTALVLALAIRFRLARAPDGRRWSKRAVPAVGGIAIAGSIALLLLFIRPADGLPSPTGLVLATAAMFATGLVDDRRPLNPWIKLAIQILIAVGLVVSGYHIGGTADLPAVAISILWIVLMMNAVNLIDNMDGVAASVTATAALGLIATSQLTTGVGTMTLTTIAGASVGFLIFNWPIARIYMGDAGSLVLGTLLGALSLAVSASTASSLPVSIAVLGVLAVPVFDTVFVFTNRMRRGDSPWNGGSDHTAHLLVRRGASNQIVIAGFVIVTAIASTASYLAVSVGAIAAIPLVLLLAVIFTAVFGKLSPDALMETRRKTIDHDSEVSR